MDLLEIWHQVAPNSLTDANRVGEQLDLEIRGLREMPGKGHSRADVKNPKYRFWRVYSWIVAYEYDDVTFTVLRVVHGHRNFRKLFR